MSSPFSQRTSCWLAVIFICGTRLTGHAQETPHSATSQPDTIEQLIADARARNPERKFYEAEIALARAERKTSAALANPELSASIGRKSVSEGGLSAEGTAWSVALAQPFEWPGRIGLRKAIADRNLELAELGFARFEAALAARVRSLDYGLIAAREKSAAANEVAERFKALRDVLVQRDSAGLTPLLETRVIEATALNAQRRATDAGLAARTALMELNQLRGMSPDAEITPAPAPLIPGPLPDHETLLEIARTNSFELRLRLVELAQQGFQIDLARHERYPGFSIAPSVSEERAGGREQIIGIGVSIPLPLWNRNRGNIDAAKARQLQAESSLRVAEREVEREVLQHALAFEARRNEILLWRPDSVEHFREAAEVADRHYRLGTVPISTYVELQKQYLEAVEGFLNTRQELIESAGKLELLIGVSPLQVTTETRETSNAP